MRNLRFKESTKEHPHLELWNSLFELMVMVAQINEKKSVQFYLGINPHLHKSFFNWNSLESMYLDLPHPHTSITPLPIAIMLESEKFTKLFVSEATYKRKILCVIHWKKKKNMTCIKTVDGNFFTYYIVFFLWCSIVWAQRKREHKLKFWNINIVLFALKERA